MTDIFTASISNLIIQDASRELFQADLGLYGFKAVKTHTHTSVYTRAHMCLCVCMCVCVCLIENCRDGEDE